MSRGLPSWLEDERMLALEVYLRVGDVGPSHPEVIELSAVLRSLPLHPERSEPTFRSPSSVGRKLANFRHLDPEKPGGLPNVSYGDAQTWEAFHDRRSELTQIAREIRTKAAGVPAGELADPVGDEEASEEGRVLVRLHHSRERDPRLVRLRKEQAAQSPQGLICEACGFDFADAYGPELGGFIECHHVLPLAASGPRRTKLEDLALRCANCHRAAHRLRPWPSIADLQALLSSRA